MDDRRALGTIEKTRKTVKGYMTVVSDETAGIRKSVRGSCAPLQEEIELRISSCELPLVRATALLSQNAEYHILSAYYHASPGLIAFLTGLYHFVAKVVDVISTFNHIVLVITGENLAHWVDMLLPGFQAVWDDLMQAVMTVSSQLNWGLDSLNHVMNAREGALQVLGVIGGKGVDSMRMEKYNKTRSTISHLQGYTLLGKKNPAELISKWGEDDTRMQFGAASRNMGNFVKKLDTVGEAAATLGEGLGTITGELLAIQTDMPKFIADNIPPGIWNALEVADTAINDRILPALTAINDRIDEVDAMLDAYQTKAAELAERLAHPGDLLAEIDKLPGYARNTQLVKIDGVTSMLMKEGNEADFDAIKPDLEHFALVAAALQNPPPPIPFMQLELPGRSPGITPEPKETWFVGDY